MTSSYTRSVALLAVLMLGLAGCTAAQESGPMDPVPAWAADMIWYQIFPERFRNGDPGNDPVRTSLPGADRVAESWSVTPWTADWYTRAAWEPETNSDFYRTVRLRRYGGDLQGVIDRLPYLEQLGVTALYFNPIFWARSEHKYDGNLFHHIDPYFGPDPSGDLDILQTEGVEPVDWVWTAADSLFLVMVREAHARGLRVIIDGVFNHVGRDFPAFVDVRRNGPDSKYRDWFKVLSWDDPSTEADEFDYEGWWGTKSLPEFADTPDSLDLAPGPKAYVFAATARWMDPDGNGDPSDGVDGWRLDVAQDVPVAFWADWNRHVRSIHPDAYTVAEIWEDPARFVAEGGFSASMNYRGFAFPTKGYLIDRRMAAAGFGAALVDAQTSSSRSVTFAMQNLIDSHDTERIASMIVNATRKLPYERPDSSVWFDYDWGRHSSANADEGYLLRRPTDSERGVQRLAALFQMTYVGAPMIYYGTETGMWSGDDPDDRQPMVWEDLVYEDQASDPRGLPRTPEPVRYDPELHEYYRSIISLRRSHETLRRGDFEVLHAEESSRAFLFARTLEEERLVIGLNPSDAAEEIVLSPVTLGLGTGEGLYPIFSTTRPVSSIVPEGDAESVRIRLEPGEGLVFIRTGME